jgi:S-methylmethionine-dependent homocysteine/selenocysteine methylase
MAKYRSALPQLGGQLFLADGGLETTLVFLERVPLPEFAAYPLVATSEGEALLRAYFRPYADLALRHATGFVLEAPTWRANADWGARLGHDRAALAALNRRAIRLLESLRAEIESERTPVVLNAIVGTRGDGYVPGRTMSSAEAEAYHAEQIETFADTAADLVSAMTLNYVEEAIGIARAARRAAMPVAISFTVETDGKLPTGQPLREAIERVEAESAGYPAYYGINCAHPAHFEAVLREPGSWRERIVSLRANASRRSHAELNEASELDVGDPAELGREYAALKRRLPALRVLGGCCGTDARHVGQIAAACAPLFA